MEVEESEKERERVCVEVYRAFGFLHIRFWLCLPDKLAHLIHLPKRHLPEKTEEKETDEDSRRSKWDQAEPQAGTTAFNTVAYIRVCIHSISAVSIQRLQLFLSIRSFS